MRPPNTAQGVFRFAHTWRGLFWGMGASLPKFLLSVTRYRLYLLILSAAFLILKVDSSASTDFPRNPIPDSEVSFKALFWESRCLKNEEGNARDCSIPQAVEAPVAQAIHLPIKAAFRPGQGAISRTPFQQDGVVIDFDVYSIFPSPDSEFPPFVQIQVELKAPVKAVCMQSIRWRESFEVPSLVCAGYREQGDQLLKWGLSLTQVTKPLLD